MGVEKSPRQEHRREWHGGRNWYMLSRVLGVVVCACAGSHAAKKLERTLNNRNLLSPLLIIYQQKGMLPACWGRQLQEARLWSCYFCQCILPSFCPTPKHAKHMLQTPKNLKMQNREERHGTVNATKMCGVVPEMTCVPREQ